jgi:hypothetical protein
MIKRSVTYLFLLLSFGVFAQNASMRMEVNRDSAALGEPLNISLIFHNFSSTPLLLDSAFYTKQKQKFTLLKSDSLRKVDADIFSTHIYANTYDTGYVVLGPFAAINGVDTIFSKPKLIYVSYQNVDMNADEKAAYLNEIVAFTFWQNTLLILVRYGWILIVLALLIFGIYRFIKKKKESVDVEEQLKPALPIHEEFLVLLDTIKAKQLWLNGNIKQHHTEITDAIRNYIAKRYGINALELTSSQTLNLLKRERISTEQKDKLKMLLTLSDLVKFAKEQPTPEENERLIDDAKAFILSTKPAIHD